MTEIIRLRDLETEAMVTWNGTGTLAGYIHDYLHQGRRKWRPHGIQLPAEQEVRELAPVDRGPPAGHRA